MQNRVNRASQFMPFDALSGFSEALREIERVPEDKKMLSSDQEELLNNQFQNVHVGSRVQVSFYFNSHYTEIVGCIQKINYYYKWIMISKMKIALGDIISIKALEKDEEL